MALFTEKNLIKSNWLSDLAGAWIFYTILPKLPFINPSFTRIARFSTLIGVILGSLQSLIWISFFKLGWPVTSLTLMSLALGMFLTGGLHIDGLIDTADGIGAGPEKCLNAMKDSRIGAIGFQSFIFILMIQIAALIQLGSQAIFAFPIASFFGRLSQLWAIGNYKYLSKSKNSLHKLNWKGLKFELIPSLITLTVLILSLSFTNFKIYLIAVILFGVLASITTPLFINMKLGWHNGDTYGASIVIVETLELLFLAIIFNPK